MIKKLFVLSFSFYLIVIAGCYKDKGNYEYKDINSLTITADVPYSVSVLLQDTLKINTTITETIPSSAGYEYEWVLYPVGTATTRWKLGISKNLKAHITQTPGQYTLDYFVKDKGTGVSFRRTFNVSVIGKFTEGWLVLEENAGSNDLGMITPIDVIF